MKTEYPQGLYPIGTVSNITGINPVTLRAWERRYQLINPTRTESGHRLYSEHDIEQIKLILALLDEGIAISRVKDAMRVAADDSKTTAGSTHWAGYRDQMLNAVNHFDENALDSAYNEAMSLYPVDVVTKQLLLPLLEKLGQQWKHASAGIAEEHFFSEFMRNKLGARFHHRNLQNTGPRLLAACLPGEEHEFGLLLFALSAQTRGYRIILLGGNMPLDQLSEVVHRTDCNGIVLSGSIEPDLDLFVNGLTKLVHDSGVPVWVGGETSDKFSGEIESAGAVAVGSDLIVGLHTIQKSLPANR